MKILIMRYAPLPDLVPLRQKCHKHALLLNISVDTCRKVGYVVAQLVEAPRYKPEGRGFDSRLCHWNFSMT